METKIEPSSIDTTNFTSKSISELVDAARKRATPVYDFNVPPFIGHPMNQHGTEALEQVAKSLSSLIKRAVTKFADGLQLSDLTFIPESLGDVMVIAKNIPQSVKEAGDLNVEEITKIFGIVLAEAVAVYSTFKNKPSSIK